MSANQFWNAICKKIVQLEQRFVFERIVKDFHPSILTFLLQANKLAIIKLIQ